MCTCHMQIDNPVREDIYQLDLWAGGQLLWNSSFKPSEHGEWGGAGGGARGGAGLQVFLQCAGQASFPGEGHPSSLLPFPKPHGVLASFWASVLPSLKWSWAQEYIRPRSVQIFQPSEFKCPDQRVE